MQLMNNIPHLVSVFPAFAQFHFVELCFHSYDLGL